MRKTIFSIFGTSLLFMACGGESPPMVEEVSLTSQVENGVSLNGTSLQATSLSFANFEAQTTLGEPFAFPTGPFDGLGFNPPDTVDFSPFGGLGPNGVSFDGQQLFAHGSVQLSSDVKVRDMLGAELEGQLVGGDKVSLFVTGVAVGPAPNNDLLYYTIHARTGEMWSPICGLDDDGQVIPAMAVPGEWDHRQGHKKGGKWTFDDEHFSLVCRGSSIAKCMELGYKPWVDPESEDGKLEVRKTKDMDEPAHLQACVRMIRADYCGDGTPFTVDGRTVEVWDSMGLHKNTQNWSFEAAWSPEGAVCMSEPRVHFKRAGVKLDKKEGIPECLEERLKELEESKKCLDDEKDYLKDDKFLFSSFEQQLR